MARLSDLIEGFIKQMFENSERDELQIQRNELANYFSCAPSQINYVLTTRFTTDKGYCIESRRGGGGCIVIRRLEFASLGPLLESLNERIKDNITYDSSVQIIDWLYEKEIISDRESDIMKMAINDRVLSSSENRNKLRADILKAMLIIILS